MSERGLTIMVHGDSKVGKTTFGASAPYPRLAIDVEGGYRFLPINPVYWDPKSENPPVADGTWDTCIVNCRDYDTWLRVYQWLQIGQHPFKSVIVDSISELQTKCLESIAGRGAVQMQQYGELARTFTGMMRDLRDLCTHPTTPLEAVVITAMSSERDGKYGPFLTGQSKTVAPYLFDLVGALVVEEFPNPDPSQPPYKVRRMYIDQHPRYITGERVQGRLGSVVEQADLNVEAMIDRVFGPRPTTQTDVPVTADETTTGEELR